MSDREEIHPLRRLLRPPEGEPSPAPRLGEAQHVRLRRVDGALRPEPVTLAPGPPAGRRASTLVATLLALSLGGSLVALTLVGVGSIPGPPALRAPEPLTPEVEAPPLEVAAPPGAESEGSGGREGRTRETRPAEPDAQPAVLGGKDEQAAAGGSDGGGGGGDAGGGDGDQRGGGAGGGDATGPPGQEGGELADVVEDVALDGDDLFRDDDDVDEVRGKVTGQDKARQAAGKAKDAAQSAAKSGGKGVGHVKAKGKGHLKDTPGLGHDKHAEGVSEGVGGVPGLG